MAGSRPSQRANEIADPPKDPHAHSHVIILATRHSRSTVQDVNMVTAALHAVHRAVSACTPTLVYQDTPSNAKLLQQCPVLGDVYHPTWYLFNGHLQTINVGRGGRAPPMSYKRQMVTMADGGQVSLDWALPSSAMSTKDTTTTTAANDPDEQRDHPTVLMLHGLTGDSQNNYIRSAAQKLIRRGWRVVVLNARGCGNTPVTSPHFLSAAHTEDVRAVVAMLRRDHVPHAPLIGVGFSLGSNILVKYVGEEGARCRLTAAVSIGNVFDLVNNTRHMNSPFYYYFYNLTISKTMLRLFFDKSNAHEQFVDHPNVDLEHLRAAKTAYEFDDRLTCKAHGYPSVEAYYQDASSAHYIPHVRIPLLCLSSLDDPVCTRTSIPFAACAANKHVILVTTARGGHLGFYTGNSLADAPEMWSSTVVEQFCGAAAGPHASLTVVVVPNNPKPSTGPIRPYDVALYAAIILVLAQALYALVAVVPWAPRAIFRV
ncbi:Aste57867_13669 [Aphanomyces stellatus]|uniref:Aste57867_13669 protein n=1 Tax=Aphanomyces stellatus TaxID=120398 RepID=A0A485KYN4_9STRA|nr:hypothetical protein As57867_013619 [Aphanomyces stellatus]VFT90503.1 Aste57867_13669 [Aphanomyces stellatus]